MTVELEDLDCALLVKAGEIDILDGEAIEGGLRPKDGSSTVRFRYR